MVKDKNKLEGYNDEQLNKMNRFSRVSLIVLIICTILNLIILIILIVIKKPFNFTTFIPAVACVTIFIPVLVQGNKKIRAEISRRKSNNK